MVLLIHYNISIEAMPGKTRIDHGPPGRSSRLESAPSLLQRSAAARLAVAAAAGAVLWMAVLFVIGGGAR